MAQYATATELAGFLQKDLDTYSANQALTVASALFSNRAKKWWLSWTATQKFEATLNGYIALTYTPATAVTAIRINGAVQPVDYTLRLNRVYRTGGFGNVYASPPDEGEIDYTFGLGSAAPDMAKGAVLETAGGIYEQPNVSLASETIGGYSYRIAEGAGGFQLSKAAREVADWYRGVLVA